MTKHSIAAGLLLAALFLGIAPVSSQSSNDEALGQQAEQAGRLREALTDYVTALQTAPAGSAADQRLREQIIALAQKLAAAPVVPEEARRHFVIANTYVRDAKTPENYNQAIVEYRNALLLAPWFGDAYSNLGVALEAAGNHSEAVRMLKLYLLTNPSPADARSAQDRIYEIEAKQTLQQQAQREAQEKSQAAERAARELRNRLGFWLGRWTLKIATSNVPRFPTFHGTFEFQLTDDHTIEGYGVITRIEESVTNPYRSLALRGTVAGSDPSSIRWTYFFSAAGWESCRNRGSSWNSWIPVSVTTGFNTISFTVPWITLVSDGCREFQGRRYELTR